MYLDKIHDFNKLLLFKLPVINNTFFNTIFLQSTLYNTKHKI